MLEFASLVDRLAGTNLVLCGEFNCKGTDGSSFDHRLDQVSSDLGLAQHVNSPTHIYGNMLDLIFTNVGGIGVEDVCVIDAGVADHYLVSCCLVVFRTLKIQETFIKRRLSCLNIEDLAEKFSSRLVAARGSLMTGDTNQFCSALQTSLLLTLD